MTELARERLILLNFERARAAIAWPLVDRFKSPGAHREHAGGGVYYDPAQWMRLADLPLYAHDDVALGLFRTGVIEPSGAVSDEALEFALALVRKIKPR